MNILTYLETEMTNKWQILCEDEMFRMVLAVAPAEGAIVDLKSIIKLDVCSIYVIVPNGSEIIGNMQTYTVGPNETPLLGILVLIGKYLSTESYNYGVLHKL